jgi:hypothetical protein
LPVNASDQFHNTYVFAGQIWPEKFDVYHIDFKGGRIAFGPATSRFGTNGKFLTACARAFGFVTPCFNVVAVLGGRPDYQWLFDPRNHGIRLPAPEVIPEDPCIPPQGDIGRLNRINIPRLFDARLRELQREWRKVNWQVVLFYLGTGQRSQMTDQSPDAGNIIDAGFMPRNFDLFIDSALRHLRGFMLHQQSIQQVLKSHHDQFGPSILYTVVSRNYFSTVTSDGIPANYRFVQFTAFHFPKKKKKKKKHASCSSC